MTETFTSSASRLDPAGTGAGAATGGRVRNAALPLFVVCAVQFLDAMDIATMGPALPQIQRELGMTPDALQWVVSAYTLGFGSTLLLGGRLADLFDRKNRMSGLRGTGNARRG
ncbi:MFS transporter [Microtetraspora sp. AC03309]|uniref:MFS transporter n=1 Tax=Microtetraspora sp. AC03309 TaxID=2779376 RepID=UPI001E36BDA0|nr:MFS transporter [Microtetraspora sp. AC03309]MCC5580866.1 MFS transporter [Microtetraspora sp. AC03309]